MQRNDSIDEIRKLRAEKFRQHKLTEIENTWVAFLASFQPLLEANFYDIYSDPSYQNKLEPSISILKTLLDNIDRNKDLPSALCKLSFDDLKACEISLDEMHKSYSKGYDYCRALIKDIGKKLKKIQADFYPINTPEFNTEIKIANTTTDDVFNSASDEVMLNIMKFLDKNSFLNFGATCRRLNKLSHDRDIDIFSALDYSIESSRKAMSLPFSIDSDTSFVKLKENKIAVSDSKTHSIYILSLNKRTAELEVETLNGHRRKINSLAMLSSGLLASADDGGIRIWDLSSPLSDKCIAIHRTYNVRYLAALTGNRLIVCRRGSGNTLLEFSNSPNLVREKPMFNEPGLGYPYVMLSNERVACRKWAEYINILNVNSVLDKRDEPSLSFIASPNVPINGGFMKKATIVQVVPIDGLIALPNNHLASLTYYKQSTIKFWKLNDTGAAEYTGVAECVSELTDFNDKVCAMASIPGGKFVTATSNQIKIWDLRTLAKQNTSLFSPNTVACRCIATLDIDSKAAFCVSLDDGRLVSILFNNTINVDTFSFKPAIQEKPVSQDAEKEGCRIS